MADAPAPTKPAAPAPKAATAAPAPPPAPMEPGPRRKRVGMMQLLNLNLFAWIEERFKLRHYAQSFRWMFYRINMQFPISHTERYKLRIIWYWYPLYTLGSMALAAFVVATITGILLGFYYIPSIAPVAKSCVDYQTTEAWKSIACDIYGIPFGFMLRQLHFWSAMVMVAAVFLHMLRVFFTQAYKKPRELNWLIGVGLLVFTLGLGYTGYLLPWSQLSFWAGRIGLEMATATPPAALGEWAAGLVFGGMQLGQATVTRMYILHVFILPIVTYLMIGLHIFIVWIQGIAEPH